MQNLKLKTPNSTSFQPLDRTALALMLILALLMALLASSGFRSAPQVRDFSWQGKQVGAEENKFILTFSRPMDHTSVEANLRIKPLLAGKVSWAGRRMAYTLNSPAPYDTPYKVELQGARDSFTAKEDKGTVIAPFTGSFQTRDRAFIYQGVEGEEQGRLILYNLSKQQKSILTPKDMEVKEFEAFPNGDRILFSAISAVNQNKGLQEQQLYTVTTGINPPKLEDLEQKNQSPLSFLWRRHSVEQPAGRRELLLDSKDYQNLKFDLSGDGQTIVIQRLNKRNPIESSLWMLKQAKDGDEFSPAQSLENEPGGDFLITPDSNSVAIAQGQGVAILPLQPKAKPIDFLPKYGVVLNFTKDNAAGAMVKFNTDNPQKPTRSLFLVPNQSIKPGIDKELLRTTGSILSCQFDPLGQNLYCLLTELLPGEEYQEQPYLAAIDLKTAQIKPLLLLPKQRDIQMSVSPDGLAILFDQIVTTPQSAGTKGLRTYEAEAIATSRLWLLPLMGDAAGKLQPEQLPLPGLHPRWLP